MGIDPVRVATALDSPSCRRTALRAGEGWAAGWRKRGDASRQLRFDVRGWLNRATGFQWNRRRLERGGNAACQMLEHLALETIVIGRVTRTARDSGRVALVIVHRGRRCRSGALMRRAVFRRTGLRADPGQQPQ